MQRRQFMRTALAALPFGKLIAASEAAVAGTACRANRCVKKD
jgi:hypothetical protein